MHTTAPLSYDRKIERTNADDHVPIDSSHYPDSKTGPIGLLSSSPTSQVNTDFHHAKIENGDIANGLGVFTHLPSSDLIYTSSHMDDDDHEHDTGNATC